MNASRSINPATGKLIATHPFQTDARLAQALEELQQGFRAWAQVAVAARADFLARLATALRQNNERLAQMASAEMGKPIVQARAEVEKCAALCDWYASHGPALMADESTTMGAQAHVAFRPLGPVLAVMPWNFPYWQILRGAVPILLGGNAYLLKHAPNVMGCAWLMAEMMAEAGLPAGAFTVIHVTPDQVSAVIADRRVASVAVTGSVRAGSAIAAQAGAHLKKTVLELGGSDPFIVLADADIDAAVEAAVASRFHNSGQICIAAKRIILEAPIAAAFTSRFVAAVDALPMGDPLDDATRIGPMARDDLRAELAQQVASSVDAGAICLVGGQPGSGPGYFYPPTVLADVRPGMAVFDQETFGPVAPLIVAQDAEDAIALANNSEFGLSAALWTEDRARAEAIASRLETGGCFINSFSASDPRVPIGGVKQSGYGRELSHFGVREFLNAQTIWFGR